MSRMRLRPACSQDLPSIADLAAQAMLEDELFTHLCPHRYEHYPSFRYGFLRRLKKRLVTPGHVMMVAVENGTLGAGELIRGYAVWERIGKVGVPQLNDTWGNGEDTFAVYLLIDSIITDTIVSPGAKAFGSRRSISCTSQP